VGAKRRGALRGRRGRRLAPMLSTSLVTSWTFGTPASSRARFDRAPGRPAPTYLAAWIFACSAESLFQSMDATSGRRAPWAARG
jgi:hypothetical protein